VRAIAKLLTVQHFRILKNSAALAARTLMQIKSFSSTFGGGGIFIPARAENRAAIRR